MTQTFTDWFATKFDRPPADMHLEQVFAVAVTRIEEATTQHAADPISSVGNCASAFSRRATKRTLLQLGYNDAQVRIVRRLLAGSSERWPGLIRLYLNTREDDGTAGSHSDYVARQLREFRRAAQSCASTKRRPG